MLCLSALIHFFYPPTLLAHVTHKACCLACAKFIPLLHSALVFVCTLSNVSFRAFLACLRSYIRCLAATSSHDPLPPSTLTTRPSLTPLRSGEEKPTTSLPLPTPSALFCMRVIRDGEVEESVTGQSCSTVTSSEHTDTRWLLHRHRGRKRALLRCCSHRNESL